MFILFFSYNVCAGWNCQWNNMHMKWWRNDPSQPITWGSGELRQGDRILEILEYNDLGIPQVATGWVFAKKLSELDHEKKLYFKKVLVLHCVKYRLGWPGEFYDQKMKCINAVGHFFELRIIIVNLSCIKNMCNGRSIFNYRTPFAGSWSLVDLTHFMNVFFCTFTFLNFARTPQSAP